SSRATTASPSSRCAPTRSSPSRSRRAAQGRTPPSSPPGSATPRPPRRPPPTLTPADGPGGWAMAELDDGRVGFAYRAFGNATPWRLAQLDTATRAASSEDVPDAAGLAAYQYGSMTVLHDGSALVARLVGSDVSVDRLSQDGSG